MLCEKIMNIKLIINQSDYLTSFYISELTNHAKVNLNEINYNTEEKQAVIYLTRFKVVSGKKFLGLGECERDYNTQIKSKIIIKNIQNAEIVKADTCADVNEITLIFGISIEKNKIYFGSAEEATGKHCFNASFFGDNLILEIEDIEK